MRIFLWKYETSTVSLINKYNRLTIFLLNKNHSKPKFIIVKVNWQYGFLWLYLAIRHYQPLLLIILLDGTQYPHTFDEWL